MSGYQCPRCKPGERCTHTMADLRPGDERPPYYRKAMKLAGGMHHFLHETLLGRPIPWLAAKEQRLGIVAGARESARRAGAPFYLVHVQHQLGCRLLDGPGMCTCGDPTVTVEQ